MGSGAGGDSKARAGRTTRVVHETSRGTKGWEQMRHAQGWRERSRCAGKEDGSLKAEPQPWHPRQGLGVGTRDGQGTPNPWRGVCAAGQHCAGWLGGTEGGSG